MSSNAPNPTVALEQNQQASAGINYEELVDIRQIFYTPLHFPDGFPVDIGKLIQAFLNNEVNDRNYVLERLIASLAKEDTPVKFRNLGLSLLVNRLWVDLEHPPRALAGDYFRSLDGSNNSRLYPEIGKANTPFARTVSSKKLRKDTLPDANQIFTRLMERPDSSFKPHPGNINTLLFHFATLVTHDLFHSDPRNPTVNLTTHYLDLSWLYGTNEKEQKKVRTGANGLIKPDYFSDTRLSFQLGGVSALMVLFSRNHNYIARQLLNTANAKENSRFTHANGENSSKLSETEKDERLFQTARLVNGACYINLILDVYLPAILGSPTGGRLIDPFTAPPATNSSSGNICAIEFNFVYRWHSALGQADTDWLRDNKIAELFLAIKKATDPGAVGKIIVDFLKQHGYSEAEINNLPVFGLHRTEGTGAFITGDVIKNLKLSIQNIASELGARQVPAAFKEIEISGIEQGRTLGVCTLNEFRENLRLKPHKNWTDINPDKKVADELQSLYKDINNVELYPGLVAEQTKNVIVGGKVIGLCLPFTSSRAILSDAVNLLRNDRILTDDLTPHNLTNWGWEYAHQENLFTVMVKENLDGWLASDDHLLKSPFVVQ